MVTLTYKLQYTPVKEYINIDSSIYICSDNKVHIRFRDFNTEQIISGFEKKLTYLISYLMNFCYLPKVIKNYKEEDLIKDFLKTSDINTVINTIKVFSHGKPFRGLKLAKNYRKRACKYFGNLNLNYFPLNKENSDIETAGTLQTFLDTFKISLEDYLFNDAYEIILGNFKNKSNNKFKDKLLRKEERNNSSYDFVEL